MCIHALYTISSHSFLLSITHTADSFFKVNNYQNINLIANTAGFLATYGLDCMHYNFLIFNQNYHFQTIIEEAIVNMQNMLICF